MNGEFEGEDVSGLQIGIVERAKNIIVKMSECNLSYLCTLSSQDVMERMRLDATVIVILTLLKVWVGAK